MILTRLSKVVLSVAVLSIPCALSVKPLHSHNDYTRAVPLMSALDIGIQSVEADIWWIGGKLLVGHTLLDLSTSKTLDTLYLTPILSIVNGSKASVTPISKASPLQLLIDFKTDGPTTYQPLIDALQPLRSAGLLTTFRDGVLTQGAITVVGTGNTPLASVVAANPRDVFFDANILTLYSTKPATGLEWSANIAPLASCDYGSVKNVAQMRELVLGAHDFGIKTRFWDTDSQVSTWNTFWDAGSDWVNVDDLQAASDAWAAYQARV